MCSGRKVNPYSPNAYDASLSRHYRNRLRVIHMLTSKNPRRNQQMGNCWKHLKHRPLSRSRSRRITTQLFGNTCMQSRCQTPCPTLVFKQRSEPTVTPSKERKKTPQRYRPKSTIQFYTLHYHALDLWMSRGGGRLLGPLNPSIRLSVLREGRCPSVESATRQTPVGSHSSLQTIALLLL